jgi:steroid delta-isomerase-like uncharacterized protein
LGRWLDLAFYQRILDTPLQRVDGYEQVLPAKWRVCGQEVVNSLDPLPKRRYIRDSRRRARRFEVASARDVVDQALDAFNAHDAERIRALYAEDAVFTAPGEVELKGPDAITEYAMSWLRAFPDARISVQLTLEDGSSVAERITFEGTHTDTLAGPDGDIPATHRRLSGRGLEVFRIEGGKIAEEHLYFDQVQVLTQLGLMPAPAMATS